MFGLDALLEPLQQPFGNLILPRYDCRKFGLVRSLVGADTGNDIMEHLK